MAEARRWLSDRGVQVPGPPSTDTSCHAPPVATTAEPQRNRDRMDAEATTSPTQVGLNDDPEADPESVARAIVLRKLAAQARTRAELERALHAKQVPDEAGRVVLDRMEAVGLIDDQSFAADWVESRQQRRHLSRSALRRELEAKGVDREQIDSALESVKGDDELDAARALAIRKARTMDQLAPRVRYRRLAGVLARRGFSAAIVSRVLTETLSVSQAQQDQL